MATLTKPSSPGWRSVTATFVQSKARLESPFSYRSQTQIHAGSKWQFELELPPMTASAADAWKVFLHELERDDDDFALVVTGYVPTGISSPMTVRLISKPQWSHTGKNFVSVSFVVEQKQ